MTIKSFDKDLKSHFFKQLGSQFNRCLEPTMQCKKKAIRAHSVQNSGVLDLLCKEGHVIQLQFHFEGESNPQINYKLIGRNRATTFAGLCSGHDRSIFEEIDTKPIDCENDNQLYLLAYRSILRGMHATMDGAARLQSTYQKRVDLGHDPKGEPSQVGSEAIYHMLKSWRIFRYKCKYDGIYKNGELSKLIHITRIVDTTMPTIAASVFFCLGKHIGAEDIKGVIINIVPLETNKTLVVFSYLKEHKLEAESELSDILVANGYYFNYLVSRVLLKRGENFVISPEYFELWSEEKKQAISDYFVNTMFNSDNDEESEHFYLF